MTDIWRSFVAQRIAWENNWSVLFHKPTMWQKRNEHNLINDFADEIPGYLHNEKICNALEGLSIKSGIDNLGLNLTICYEKLVELGMIDEKELSLIDAWLDDMEKAFAFVNRYSIIKVLVFLLIIVLISFYIYEHQTGKYVS